MSELCSTATRSYRTLNKLKRRLEVVLQKELAMQNGIVTYNMRPIPERLLSLMDLFLEGLNIRIGSLRALFPGGEIVSQCR
jgi:hypothetical protein